MGEFRWSPQSVLCIQMPLWSRLIERQFHLEAAKPSEVARKTRKQK